MAAVQHTIFFHLGTPQEVKFIEELVAEHKKDAEITIREGINGPQAIVRTKYEQLTAYFWFMLNRYRDKIRGKVSA